MKKIMFLVSLIFGQFAYCAPIVIAVGSIADVDCQFNTIQAAIDSGLINMDIRVSNQLDTLDGISIIDKDVSYIRGGYASCQDAINDVIDVANPQTHISGINDAAITIQFLIDNSHTINLFRLDIANMPEALSVSNGGANVSLTINLDSVDMHDGSTGILTNGTGIVINFDNGSITRFINDSGVHCIDSEINFGEFVAINDNHASIGGGIFADNCAISLKAGDSNPVGSLQYGVYSNTAQNFGAGIALTNASSLIALGTTGHPVSISNNSFAVTQASITKGGGIYLSSGSIAQLLNVRLDHNSSYTRGAAIYMNSTNAAQPAQLTVARTPEACLYNQICNSMSFNQTSDLAVNAAKGAVIYQNGGEMVLSQIIIQGNSAQDSALFTVENEGTLAFLSSLIVNNSTLVDLFDMKNLSNLFVYYSTLADNQTSNYFNVQYDNSNAQVLLVEGTIIKNAAATIANLNNDMGNHDAQVICSLVENDDATGVVQNLSLIGLPSFVGAGNYKLKENSLGLNSTCTNIGFFDLVRYDLLNVDRLSSPTPDIGAYQMGYLFLDGFE